MKWIFILTLILSTIKLSDGQDQKSMPKLDILYLFYQDENLTIWHSWDIDTTKNYGKPIYQRIKLNELWKN